MANPKDLKLVASEPITENDGKPNLKLQRKWQEILKKLDEHEARLTAGGL